MDLQEVIDKQPSSIAIKGLTLLVCDMATLAVAVIIAIVDSNFWGQCVAFAKPGKKDES